MIGGTPDMRVRSPHQGCRGNGVGAASRGEGVNLWPQQGRALNSVSGALAPSREVWFSACGKLAFSCFARRLFLGPSTRGGEGRQVLRGYLASGDFAHRLLALLPTAAETHPADIKPRWCLAAALNAVLLSLPLSPIRRRMRAWAPAHIGLSRLNGRIPPPGDELSPAVRSGQNARSSEARRALRHSSL